MNKSKASIIARALLFWGVFQMLVLGMRFGLPELPKWALAISYGGILTLSAIGLTKLFLKSEQMTMSDLGLTFGRKSLMRFFVGLIAGVAFFGCMYLVYIWLTPVTVVAIADVDIVKTVIISFLAFLVLGSMEEIVFRGYLLRKLDSAIGMRLAIYISSIAFGLYHGLTIDSWTGPAIWGLLYAVLVYWTKGLAVPIGFHAGVNLVQAFFSQKEKWVNGIWNFEVADNVALFTIDQVSIILKVLLLVIGIVLVEALISRRSHS